MRQSVLLDMIQVGVEASENRHPVFGEFARLGLPHLSNYGGASNIHPWAPLCHFRNAPRFNGFRLSVPAPYVGTDLVLELCLKTYATGEDLPEVRPTIVEVMGQNRWTKLDEFTVPQDDSYHCFRLLVPGEVVDSDGLIVYLNDSQNYQNRDRFYGKTYGYLQLSGDPKKAGQGIVPKPFASERPDIVLVMCPVWDILMPPVALGTLASTLQGNGVNVAVYDFNIELYHKAAEGIERQMWDGESAVLWEKPEYGQKMYPLFEQHFHEAAQRILAYEAPFVGMSIAVTSAEFSVRMAKLLKELRPDVKIIFGGPGLPSFKFQGQLGPHWDYMIYGAGEKPLISILRDGELDVRGLLTQDTWAPYDPEANRAVLDDLDSMPLTHFNHFNLFRYIQPWRLPMITSRGCINACKYCFDTIYYKPFMCLTGKRAFEQVRYLHANHGRRVFEFSDLLCNGDLDQLRIMCNLLSEANLGIEWGSFAVMRSGMTPELLALVRASGCRYLHYGFETGSAKMLKLMNRNYNVQDAQDCLRNTKRAGIQTRTNIIVGFPGETEQTVEETITFIRRNAPYIDMVDTVNPVFLMESTDLQVHKDQYGIDVSAEGWTSEGSNPEVRHRWVNKIMKALGDHGVQVNFSMLTGTMPGAYKD